MFYLCCVTIKNWWQQGKFSNKAMKTITIKDRRINRNNNMGGYIELCNELIQAQGFNKKVSGCSMTYNNFTTTAYRKNWQDVQVDINLDFNDSIAIITIK